jgi:hypothetical protein
MGKKRMRGEKGRGREGGREGGREVQSRWYRVCARRHKTAATPSPSDPHKKEISLSVYLGYYLREGRNSFFLLFVDESLHSRS